MAAHFGQVPVPSELRDERQDISGERHSVQVLAVNSFRLMASQARRPIPPHVEARRRRAGDPAIRTAQWRRRRLHCADTRFRATRPGSGSGTDRHGLATDWAPSGSPRGQCPDRGAGPDPRRRPGPAGRRDKGPAPKDVPPGSPELRPTRAHYASNPCQNLVRPAGRAEFGGYRAADGRGQAAPAGRERSPARPGSRCPSADLAGARDTWQLTWCRKQEKEPW